MHSRRWSHSPHAHAFEVIRYTILLLAARAVAGLISDCSLVPYPTKELPPSKQCPSLLLTQFLYSWFELKPTSIVRGGIWQSLCACFLHYTHYWVNCLSEGSRNSTGYTEGSIYGLFATDKTLNAIDMHSGLCHILVLFHASIVCHQTLFLSIL